jgi:hypothetical protein
VKALLVAPLLLALPALAGCLDAKVCVGSACSEPTEASHPWPPAVPFAQVHWEGCRGLVGTFHAPRDALRAAVPDAYRLVDEAPLAAPVQFKALHCTKIAATNRTLQDVGAFAVMVRVQPRNESWSQNRPSFFLVDLVLTSDDLRSRLRELGVDARTATLRVDTVLAPSSALRSESWRFESPDFAVEFPVTFTHPSEATESWIYWGWHAAPDGFRRVETSQGFRYDDIGQEAGTLRIDGGLRSAAFLPSGRAAWAGQPYSFDEEVWTGDPRVFVAA